MRNFELPGRSLSIARNGMVATSHPASTLAAVDILRRGGNAVDAAVAAAAVQGVVEAGSTGIGGDCFVLLSKGGSTDILAYNGSGRAPAAATLDALEARGVSALTQQSPHAVTVPGAVEAWGRLVRDHGKLDFGEILQPAIAYARDGYAITPRVAADIGQQVEHLRANAAATRIFLPGNEAPKAGSVHAQPELATTLAAIAENGPDAFYKDAVAQDMVECLQSLGGLQTLADFAAAKGEYVSPIKTDFRGRDVYECPPNGQGIIALLIMNILSRFKPKADPLDIDNLHIEIEATRLAYAARDAYLADNAGSATAEYLLSQKLADDLAARIDPGKPAVDLPAFDTVEHKDTVYVSVVDKDRNAISFINSIFSIYGSGIVSPRTGVLLHNRGQSFSMKRGHENQIAPGKRPMHTIIPAMVAQGGRVNLSFGVMGGHYQAMGHAHVLSKLYDHGMDIQSAIDLPRLFPLPGTKTVECEGVLRAAIGPELERRGFKVQAPARAIGGAQAVAIDWERGTLLGASDCRKDGCALGF